MTIARKSIVVCTILLFAANVLFPRPAFCLPLKKEREVSREFMEMVLAYFELIEDPLITDYVNQVGQRILSHMPPQPFTYRFYVIKERQYNAFAGPGGLVFIYSGLFAAMESEEELAGILSHEISHIANRHLSQRADRSKVIGLATLAGIAAGILLGVAGVGAASEAITIGTMAANQSLSLAYSREDEMEADKTGLRYLTDAGYSGKGLLTILKKMRAKRWFGPDEIPTYLLTHPALEDRLNYIGTQVSREDVSVEPETEGNRIGFRWAHTQLVARYGEENAALRRFKEDTVERPESALAHYGYGLALARTADLKAGALHIKKALEKEAFNPYIIKDLGRIYFMDGRHQEALNLLKSGLSLAPEDPVSLIYLGRTQIALEKYEEAVHTLEPVAAEYESYPEALYHLGKAYGRMELMVKAHYHLGMYYTKTRKLETALFHLEKAEETTEEPDEKKKLQEKIGEVKEKIRKQQREIGSMQ